MKFLLGTKKYMSQLFGEDGKAIAVTVLAVEPAVITQVKSKDSDGYDAVQVGFGKAKEKKLSKAVKGHLKNLGTFTTLREWRGMPANEVKVGDAVQISAFAEGDKVKVIGISKGKGFQGVVKRHGFTGGRRSHGQKHSEREPGSIGGAARAGGRVAKGMRMAGRTGSDRVTMRNVTIVKIDPEEKMLYVKGAVPGRRGSVVEIRG